MLNNGVYRIVVNTSDCGSEDEGSIPFRHLFSLGGYMKKVFMLFVVLLLSVNAFAQTDQINGNFWVKCDDSQKSSIIFGYILGMSSFQVMLSDFNSKMDSGEYEYKEELYNYNESLTSWASYYPTTVGEIVQAIDMYYSKVSNRDDPIIFVIPYLFDKEWW